MEISKVKKEELEEVFEIEKECFSDKNFFSKKELLSFLEKFPEGFLVAKEGGEICGYGICQKMENLGKIVSLAVRKKWQKNGFGTKILGEMIKILEKAGVKEIILHTKVENFRAINLYKKFGFKILERIKNYYLDGSDAFLMKLEF